MPVAVDEDGSVGVEASGALRTEGDGPLDGRRRARLAEILPRRAQVSMEQLARRTG